MLRVRPQKAKKEKLNSTTGRRNNSWEREREREKANALRASRPVMPKLDLGGRPSDVQCRFLGPRIHGELALWAMLAGSASETPCILPPTPLPILLWKSRLPAQPLYAGSAERSPGPLPACPAPASTPQHALEQLHLP